MSILAVGSLRLQRFASTLASSRGRQGLAVRVEAAAAGAVEEASVTTKHERKDERSVIVIDNYDSFTYNLCQYLGNLGCKIEVYRNDDLTVEELRL
jgi:anthranilate synthase component 2